MDLYITVFYSSYSQPVGRKAVGLPNGYIISIIKMYKELFFYI